MTDASLVLTPEAGGNVEVTMPGLQIMQGDKVVPIMTVNSSDTQPVTLQMTNFPPSNGSSLDWLVFVALLVPLALTTVLGISVVFRLIRKMDLTVDKLAQMLSEENPPKMSLSRVQALLFTYVITFGCLLIIARTGQFPVAIPDDLAILAGGSLATFVVSKAIQTQAK